MKIRLRCCKCGEVSDAVIPVRDNAEVLADEGWGLTDMNHVYCSACIDRMLIENEKGAHHDIPGPGRSAVLITDIMLDEYRKQCEWIPVEAMEPPTTEDILVYRRYKGDGLIRGHVMWGAYCHPKYVGGVFYDPYTRETLYGVTHWRPIPDAPDEDEINDWRLMGE